MICNNVSRKEIRALKVGEVAIYTLPNQMAKESAKVQFSTLKRIEEGRIDFERVEEEELRNSLGRDFDTIIPDMKLTVAYRCIKNELL